MVRDTLLANAPFFAELAEKYQLRFVVLFGSVAKMRDSAHSDVDIAILPHDSENFTYALEECVANDIARYFNKRTDVTIASSANPVLLHEMLEHGVPLFEEEKGLVATYRIYAWKLLVENRPVLQTRWAQAQRAIQYYKTNVHTTYA
jgi:predicted nucleotidyltransferase